MKFIHTADIHWGMNPDHDKPWSRDRAQSIKDTFAKIVRQAKLRDMDFLFIAGDLFHRQPLLRDLKEINYLFSTIPGIQVVLIAGNHDHIRPNSALRSFSWCSNVTWLMKEQPTTVVFEKQKVDVTGFSYHTAEITEPLFDDLRAPASDHIHILLAHGGDPKHLPWDKKSFVDAGLSYAALGHIHKAELGADLSYAYPGSPEPLDKTETGRHGIVLGEISPTTRQITRLEFLPLSQAQYIPLVIHVTPATTNSELGNRIMEEASKRGLEHIYRFRVRGKRDPDIQFDLSFLERKLQVIEIIDESEPQYDFSRLFAEHPGDMIGFYIRALEKEEMSSLEKKALYYGIDALLCTTDERR